MLVLASPVSSARAATSRGESSVAESTADDAAAARYVEQELVDARQRGSISVSSPVVRGFAPI